MKIALWLVGAAVSLYGLLCLGLFLFQSRLVYMPSRAPGGNPGDLGLAWLNLDLPSRGGRIRAWFVPADRPRGTILFCHGNAGNLTHRLDTVRLLHGLGVNVLLFDYQGYGESTGEPSEAGTLADARAAWDWLRQRGEPASRIVLMGRSLGGAVAAALAEELADGGGDGGDGAAGHVSGRPAGLILESTFTSAVDVGAAMYPWLPVRLLSRYAYDTLSRLPRIPGPVLLVHSPDDELVPYAHAERLLAALGDRGTLLAIGGDHNQGFLLSGLTYTNGLDAYLDRVLGPGPGN